MEITYPNNFKNKLDKVVRHTTITKKGETKKTDRVNSVFVFCLVKNGEYYVESFIKHYLNLGINHIYLIDNGSTDNTINIACKYKYVTIVSCLLPFGEYKLAMRRYLIEQYGKNKWCLSVDIDEYWEYPYNNRIKVDCFINYLDSFGYTACISHQLDLFENSALFNSKKETSINKLDHYDLSNVFMWPIDGFQNRDNCIDTRLINFLKGNKISDKSILIMAGGVRMQLFDIIPILTKVSLFKFESQVNPFVKSSHKIEGAFIADISCVLLHKLLNNHLKEKSEKCIRDGGYYKGSYNYQKIFEKLSDNTMVTPKHAAKYISVNDLMDNNFIQISRAYLIYIKNTRDK